LGNELRSPGQSLALGEIYAANGAALGAAAESLGAEVTLTRCGDDPEALRTVVSNAIRCSDIVITSGGASVGKHDHVRPAFASLDIEEIFWKVAIRPGCPLYFGRVAPKSNQRKGCLVFGLPGNPVSSLVTFFLFVRPAIYRYYGLHSPPVVRGRTSMPLESSSEVDVFARISLHDGTIFPVQAQGSHMTSGLATATGLCRLPKGAGTIPAGSSLEVQPLQWTL
jgi:molybdopterin molybdotransferase